MSQPDAQRGCAERTPTHPRCASLCDSGILIGPLAFALLTAAGCGQSPESRAPVKDPPPAKAAAPGLAAGAERRPTSELFGYHKPAGRVAIVVFIANKNDDGQVDHARGDLIEFIKRANRRKSGITGFSFVCPTPVGEKPLRFSGKCDRDGIGAALDWLNTQFAGATGPDLPGAVAAALADEPDQLYIVSDRKLAASDADEDKVAAEIRGLAAGRKTALFGIAFGTDDADRGLAAITGVRPERVTRGCILLWGPKERSDAP